MSDHDKIKANVLKYFALKEGISKIRLQLKALKDQMSDIESDILEKMTNLNLSKLSLSSGECIERKNKKTEKGASKSDVEEILLKVCD